MHTSELNDYNFSILKSVIEVNEKQKTKIVEKIRKYFGNNLNGKKAALWGLAFKPDTDDIREAPALYIIEALLKEGVSISAYDPEAINNVKSQLGDKIKYGKDEYDVLTDADFLIIATEWRVFRTPDFNRITSLMKNKLIFDGRNVFDLNQMKDLGYTYYSIGRNKIN